MPENSVGEQGMHLCDIYSHSGSVATAPKDRLAMFDEALSFADSLILGYQQSRYFRAWTRCSWASTMYYDLTKPCLC